MANQGIGIDVFVNLQKAISDTVKGSKVMAASMAKNIAGPLNAVANTIALSTIAGLAVALTAGGKAAIEFEDAFAMVKKTMAEVDDPEVFKSIAADLQNIATQIPITSSELAGLASVAGQLGVAANDVATFTEVVGKLSVATNMTGTQAATSLARFLNVTGETTDTVGKFGSVLVQLGNNVAATESEIILLAQNFGATGNVAGLSAEDILAYSAATRESGVQAAAGATALGKLFMNISNAVKEGNLEKLSVLSRLVGEDFTQAFERDGALAVQKFLAGLNEVAKSGESVTPILSELGLNNVRTSRAVLSLANNYNGLADALALARQEVKEQNALNEEVATRQDTVAQKVALLKSTFNVFLQQIGEQFLPLFKRVLDFFIRIAQGAVGLVRAFREAKESTQAFIEIIVKSAFFQQGIKVISFLVTKINALNAKFLAAKSSGSGLIANMGKLAKVAKVLLGPFIALAAAVAAAFKLGPAQKRFTEFNSTVDNTANSLKELDEAGNSFAENFNEKTMRGIAEGLPDSIKEGVEKGMNNKNITEAGIEASQSFADGMGQSVVESLRNTVDVGDIINTESLAGDIRNTLELLKAEGIAEESEIFVLTKKLQTELIKNNMIENDKTKELQNQLAFHLQIIEATRQHENHTEAIERLIREQTPLVVQQEGFFRKIMESEEERLAYAVSIAKEGTELYNLLVKMGHISPVQTALSDIDKFLQKVEAMRTMVDDIFRPAELDFAKKFAEFDLVNANKEIVDLEDEKLELELERLDVADELNDLQNKQLLTSEELLEQQELVNEAIEIEDRLRKGQLLTANQFLRKEKLKKDLRRVELAASQGSLEFAEEEAAKIREDIAAIDDKKITQADADKLREKAAQMTHDAQVEREEEIASLEERRIEINERLNELPEAMVRAQGKVLDAQKDVLNANLDIMGSVNQLSNVTMSGAMSMAKSLGLPLAAANTLKNAIIGVGTSISNVNAMLPSFGQMSYQPMTNQQLFAKYGMGGGAYAGSAAPSYTSRNNNAGSNQAPQVNLTFNSTLPADDMLKRRAAQDITRILNDYNKGGGGGVIRGAS
jgi:TP901 family phage tail tape measure protein